MNYRNVLRLAKTPLTYCLMGVGVCAVIITRHATAGVTYKLTDPDKKGYIQVYERGLAPHDTEYFGKHFNAAGINDFNVVASRGGAFEARDLNRDGNIDGSDELKTWPDPNGEPRVLKPEGNSAIFSTANRLMRKLEPRYEAKFGRSSH